MLAAEGCVDEADSVVRRLQKDRIVVSSYCFVKLGELPRGELCYGRVSDGFDLFFH